MNELQLVGYTADLRFLVFSEAADSAARFKVPVDEDLEATLTEVLQLLDPDRAPLGRAPEPAVAPPPSDPTAPLAAPVPAAAAGGRPAPRPAPARAGGLFDEDEDEELFAGSAGRKPPRNGRRPGDPELGKGALAGQAVLLRPPAEPANGHLVPEPPEARDSLLSPRQIQALLRSGLTPRQVAKQAGTEEAWVQRWLAPIEAERDLILQAVQRGKITKARLGESRDLLGEAVRRNLSEKGVRADEEQIEWFAARRQGDPHWVVTLRYRSRGRNQRAVWHFNPDTGELEPRNALATDIAWTRARRSGRAAGRAQAIPAKKALARKTAAKKTAAKKAPGKKTAAKKKAPARKSPAGAKKTPAKKTSRARRPR